MSVSTLTLAAAWPERTRRVMWCLCNEKAWQRPRENAGNVGGKRLHKKAEPKKLRSTMRRSFKSEHKEQTAIRKESQGNPGELPSVPLL